MNLYLTVGGLHQLRMTVITGTRPDRVVIFCTDRDRATNKPGLREQIERNGLCITTRTQGWIPIRLRRAAPRWHDA